MNFHERKKVLRDVLLTKKFQVTVLESAVEKVDERKLIAEQMLAANMDAFAADMVLTQIKDGIQAKKAAMTPRTAEYPATPVNLKGKSAISRK